MEGKIYSPEKGKFVSVKTKHGQKVLKNYNEHRLGGDKHQNCAYCKIVNPKTGKMVSTYGQTGGRVIKSYNMIGGGGILYSLKFNKKNPLKDVLTHVYIKFDEIRILFFNNIEKVLDDNIFNIIFYLLNVAYNSSDNSGITECRFTFNNLGGKKKIYSPEKKNFVNINSNTGQELLKICNEKLSSYYSNRFFNIDNVVFNEISNKPHFDFEQFIMEYKKIKFDNNNELLDGITIYYKSDEDPEVEKKNFLNKFTKFSNQSKSLSPTLSPTSKSTSSAKSASKSRSPTSKSTSSAKPLSKSPSPAKSPSPVNSRSPAKSPSPVNSRSTIITATGPNLKSLSKKKNVKENIRKKYNIDNYDQCNKEIVKYIPDNILFNMALIAYGNFQWPYLAIFNDFDKNYMIVLVSYYCYLKKIKPLLVHKKITVRCKDCLLNQLDKALPYDIDNIIFILIKILFNHYIKDKNLIYEFETFLLESTPLRNTLFSIYNLASYQFLELILDFIVQKSSNYLQSFHVKSYNNSYSNLKEKTNDTIFYEIFLGLYNEGKNIVEQWKEKKIGKKRNLFVGYNYTRKEKPDKKISMENFIKKLF